jgi:hypothetical protein
MESRKARIAKNEAAFRALNERINKRQEHRIAPATEPIMFVCECGEPQCFARLSLTTAEYEGVRSDPTRFAVVPGHEKPATESVVEEHAPYRVVRKNEDVGGIVRDTDPRQALNSGAAPTRRDGLRQGATGWSGRAAAGRATAQEAGASPDDWGRGASIR